MRRATLHAVASDFARWRQSRASRRQAVPSALRQHAVELLRDHKQSQVLAALNINHAMLKRWQGDNSHRPHETFVALSDAARNEVPASHPVHVVLRHRGGGEIHLSGELSPAHVSGVVQTFLTVQGEQEGPQA